MSALLFHRRRLPLQRPTAAAERGHEQAAFVHENQAGATPTCLSLDARPVQRQPAGDGRVIAFARHAAWQLGRVAPLPQPGDQIVGVEVDSELLLDEAGQVRGGPQFRGETVLARAVCQPAAHDLLLSRGEFGRATRDKVSGQARDAVPAEVRQPATHTAGINAEEVGDLCGGVAFADAQGSQEASVFKFRR